MHITLSRSILSGFNINITLIKEPSVSLVNSGEDVDKFCCFSAVIEVPLSKQDQNGCVACAQQFFSTNTISSLELWGLLLALAGLAMCAVTN